MSAKGVAKLIEEVGELQVELGHLQQALGKKLAVWTSDDHWDGTNLRERIQDEMGDVQAAIIFVGRKLDLDMGAVGLRLVAKLRTFEDWDADPANSPHGIDADLQMRRMRLFMERRINGAKRTELEAFESIDWTVEPWSLMGATSADEAALVAFRDHIRSQRSAFPDVICSCGHAYRQHDPEDGKCDAHSAVAGEFGVCCCGRELR